MDRDGVMHKIVSEARRRRAEARVAARRRAQEATAAAGELARALQGAAQRLVADAIEAALERHDEERDRREAQITETIRRLEEQQRQTLAELADLRQGPAAIEPAPAPRKRAAVAAAPRKRAAVAPTGREATAAAVAAAKRGQKKAAGTRRAAPERIAEPPPPPTSTNSAAGYADPAATKKRTRPLRARGR